VPFKIIKDFEKLSNTPSCCRLSLVFLLSNSTFPSFLPKLFPSPVMATNQPSDATDALRTAQAALRRGDGVMEVGVADAIKQFITCGGTPQEVVKFLSENYKGSRNRIDTR
jgi:hypothetical protein